MENGSQSLKYPCGWWDIVDRGRPDTIGDDVVR